MSSPFHIEPFSASYKKTATPAGLVCRRLLIHFKMVYTLLFTLHHVGALGALRALRAQLAIVISPSPLPPSDSKDPICNIKS